MSLYPPRKKQRLPEFDYATSGWYFVTICVQHRLQLLATIICEDNTALSYPSEQGIIVGKQLLWLEEHFSSVTVDTYVLMPDHIHAILVLQNRNGNIKPLSQVVGAFKSTASKKLRMAGRKDFNWQRSFYERVIRNGQELSAIREYIVSNPLRWCLKQM